MNISHPRNFETGFSKVIFKENLELYIKSSDDVLKNYILVADWIEQLAFSEIG